MTISVGASGHQHKGNQCPTNENLRPGRKPAKEFLQIHPAGILEKHL